MVGNGKDKKPRTGSLLLLILFGLGLAGPALPETTASGAATAWVRRFKVQGDAEPSAMALDSQGNIYVTGWARRYNYRGYDFATIKYSPEGRRLWVRLYDSPGTPEYYADPDYARAIAVDGQGNVYVTGSIWRNGEEWNNDYATIKYSPDGQQLWVRHYNGPGNGSDIPTAMAVDAQGNVYVTGYSDAVSKGDKYDYDYATIKYSPDGEELWVRRYNAGKADYAFAMALDAQGNIYVTGASYNSENYFDYATIKYNPEGELLWEQRYDGPANGYDVATALAVDGQGNVYVTGVSAGYGRVNFWSSADWRYDYATVKYSADGKMLWTRRYNGPGNDCDGPTAMAVDSQGNVFITGLSRSSWDGDFDYATIKYSTDGKLLWEHLYNGPGRDNDNPAAIAVDTQGNAYVTGYSTGTDGRWGYTTIKYRTDGRRLWIKSYHDQASYSEARAIAVDIQGNVYVTGKSDYQYVTIKYIQTP